MPGLPLRGKGGARPGGRAREQHRPPQPQNHPMKTSATSLLTGGAALLLGWSAAPVRGTILYASNAGASTIEKFTSDGTRSTFATEAAFSSPEGLAFDSAGKLYTANSGANTVTKFTTGGVGSVFGSTGLTSPHGVAFDRAGNLYVANSSGQSIEKYTPGGAASVFVPPGSGLSTPIGLAFDRNDFLYEADLGDNRIWKFTLGGVGSIFASGGLLNKPTGLAFDSAGNLYVGNLGDFTILKFTIGGVGSVFASTGGLSPVGLAFDDAGMLFAVFNNGLIQKFNSLGVGTVFATGLNNPQYLAFTTDAGVPLKLANQTPEPASAALLGLGALLLAARRRGRR